MMRCCCHYIMKIYYILILINVVSCKRPIDIIRQHLASTQLPIIESLHISTTVNNRFAETEVKSVVVNKYYAEKQATFSVILPESAFVTSFVMEVNGEVYKSKVVDKQIANTQYTQSHPYLGAQVSTRDSNEFDITVKLKPRTSAVFKLSYEELLELKNSKYEIISNIFPKQFVEDLEVDIVIKEDEGISYINTPYFRSGNEIYNSSGVDSGANITIPTKNSGHIKLRAGIMKQVELVCNGLRTADSFAGQFVVEYDIVRSAQAGILADDYYFITFFSPTNLAPLRKHIIFILDVSWSMGQENRLTHLKDAMEIILPMISTEDIFHIISYARRVTVWNIEDKSTKAFEYSGDNYNNGLIPSLQGTTLPEGVSGTAENINKGIDIIKSFTNGDNTNIIGALTVGLHLISKANEKYLDKFQPIVVFLTDGLPVGAMSNTERIVSIYTQQNTLEVPTYTISLGNGANRTFLEKLAVSNGGYEKHIYEGVDKAMQLSGFYKDISTPVLKKINFPNLSGLSGITKANFPLFFKGSEIKIAGKGAIWKLTKNKSNFTISGKGNNGTITYKPSMKIPSTKLDRLWAYLTVKQLLQSRLVSNNPDITQQAINISLTYSLVTDVTALIVREPSGPESSIDIRTAFSGPRPTVAQNPMCRKITWPTPSNIPKSKTFFTTTPKTTTTTVSTTKSTTKTTTTPTTTTTTTTTSTTPTPVTTTVIPTTTEKADTPTFPPTDPPTNPPTAAPVTTTSQQTIITTPTTTTPRTTSAPITTTPITTTTPKEDINHKPLDCHFPTAAGPCDKFIVKWTYNILSGECEKFLYGGCYGNDNRFNSKEACEKTCVKMDAFDKCTIPPSSGIFCGNSKVETVWYYDEKLKKCNTMFYKGCGGNPNKFKSKNECEMECILNITKSDDECKITPDIGNTCQGKPKRRYYYIGHKCSAKIYYGCDDKKKGFESIDKCRMACVHTEQCGLSADPGHCRNHSVKYYYDKDQGRCSAFWYGGCGGNGNRFETIEECEDKCQNVMSIEKCKLPKSKGPCSSFVSRWYFDISENECKPFDYGGCFGNTNRFISKDACQNECQVQMN